MNLFWKVYSKIPFCYPYIVYRELLDARSILDVSCGSDTLIKRQIFVLNLPQFTLGLLAMWCNKNEINE